MKGLFKTALCAAVALAFTFGTAAFAAPARADDGGFTIPEYDVKIVISDSGVYDVTETITVNFTEPRHGIYRDIPLRGTMKYSGANGIAASSSYTATVTDIHVDNSDFISTTDNGYESIRIGNPSDVVQGQQTYRLSYKMMLSFTGMNDCNLVCCNIIGSDWDTEISHVLFSVTLPESFEQSDFDVLQGGEGSRGYTAGDLTVTKVGNAVVGETHRALYPNEGLTVHFVLPDGYFQDNGGLSITTGGKGSLTITPEANPDAGQDQAKNLRALAFLLIAVLVALASPGR